MPTVVQSGTGERPAAQRAALRGVALLALGALGPWSVPACTSVEPGHAVELSVVPHNWPGAPLPVGPGGGPPLARVERVLLTAGPFELVRCPLDRALATARQALRGAVARAHVPDTPTRAGGTVLVDARVAGRQPVALLTPPLGRYCALRVWFSPADVHALGVEALPQMMGVSLRAAGSVLTEDGAVPFESNVVGPVSRALSLAAPLEVLGAPQVHAVDLRVDATAAARFVLDWAGADLAQGGEAALEGVVSVGVR